MRHAAPWVEMLAVALGSAVGGVLRWRIQAWLNPAWSHGFPLGTLLVNGVGGFLIGAAMAWLLQVPHEVLRLLLVVGFMGGLTTFSSFTYESLMLLQHGRFLLALLHTAAHVATALAMAAAGFALVRRGLA